MSNFKVNVSFALFTLALGLAAGLAFNGNINQPVKASDTSNSNSLLKRTSFTIEQAESLALSKFPDAHVEEIELDADDNPLVWKIDMKMKPLTKIEFEIDARTGDVLKQEKHKW